jgi:hypothetical protein
LIKRVISSNTFEQPTDQYKTLNCQYCPKQRLESQHLPLKTIRLSNIAHTKIWTDSIDSKNIWTARTAASLNTALPGMSGNLSNFQDILAHQNAP